MNYLAHLHLGGDAPEQLLGSLYGDFVKGPLDGRFPAPLEASIRLHRRIDVFTDAHAVVLAARGRFPARLRRVSGVLLDLFFDHCLARHWDRYAEQPLDAFVTQVYRVLLDEPALPGALARVAPRMAAQDWLGSYRDFAVLEQVLAGMARRLSRPGLLDGALPALEASYVALEADFHDFYPALQRFAASARGLRGEAGSSSL